MRKIATFVIAIICIILFYFTFETALKVFRADWQMPEESKQENTNNRLVLITRELDNPFWDKVSAGARKQAEEDGARLEIWGSYGNNQEDFLRQIEIAIYSKVDGIIVQGLDTEEFKELTKVKASSYGIPIITIANDVPMAESLRRTYVGSNQYLAGIMIARQLLTDMGTSGEVVLMLDSRQEHYQKQRLEGIRDILQDYPNVQIIESETEDTREQVIATTKDLLNKYPNVDAFIAVNANFSGDIIEEMDRRSNAEPYYIYSFDDYADAFSLLKKGKLDGIIEQSPLKMGELSVNLMMKWLNHELVPLDLHGYLTDIRLIKAMDIQ
ncbi:ribose transport system substrate-binding protein [Salirhabdus euzebyi]|uniref:Ribose transport system substrate-binding protein n=1 Tax=Salirhabdus euzebyi TaxID=394506 RepID=A0A841Q5I7_9BACI|nr:substrate-binding domain-containing protein [Salirhabdus euzebyi]MBB6453661.1 ribose transport system substrate-binding protein [Salirhabdus euzebyi]